MDPPRIRVLCVDDEPYVLEGLAVLLRRRFDVVTAQGGAAGLEALQQRLAEVVISDMRMPGMDGATFLSRSREIAPDAVRVLLTGQTDVQAAVLAVNEGQIFRYLEKPCPPAALIATVEAAAALHRMATAERVLLEQTLRGSIKALTDVLALASPAAFGRTMRIRQHVTDLLRQLDMGDCWQLDVAAMVCQLGSVALPAATATKFYFGQPLGEDEVQMVNRMPAVAIELLGPIPRLETVFAILGGHSKPYRHLHPSMHDAEEMLAARGAELLKVAADFESLEAGGLTSESALDTMRARIGRYDPAVLTAFVSLRQDVTHEDIRELPLAGLQVGMVFAQDLKLSADVLLAARGYRVTAGFVERVRNLGKESSHTTVRVIVAPVAETAGAA